MRADLRLAIKSGDRIAAAALRSALAAFDNAEAIAGDPAIAGGTGSEHVAGAVSGLGAAERPRRPLSAGELADIVAAERDEHRQAAEHARAAGRADAADRHARQADVLDGYLT